MSSKEQEQDQEQHTEFVAVDELFRLGLKDDGSLVIECTEPYDDDPATFDTTLSPVFSEGLAKAIIEKRIGWRHRQEVDLPDTFDIPSWGGVVLTFARTDKRNQPNHGTWEAVRRTGEERSHRYQVWTYDGGETWDAQLQVRSKHLPGPVFSVKHLSTVQVCVQQLREAYREYGKERYE